ncbi:MAG: hypothetical protein WC116_09085 [Thermovirgaceae bacterium]|jgi:hypothetical protein
MKKIFMAALLFTLLFALASQAEAEVKEHEIVGAYGWHYTIVWDGWRGDLTLLAGVDRATLEKDGVEYAVRYVLLENPQTTINGLQGPGFNGKSSSLNHRIIFWVDFNRTPGDTSDDQRFEGYFMTQTKDAMAGITWWDNIPFGFYAVKSGEIIG